MDDDGLLAAGEPGVQLTWMDAKVGDWVVTPRIGKPVEVQALWLNALWIIAQFSPQPWQPVLDRGLAAFRARFWNDEFGCLHDIIDADHVRGRTDDSIRPNQIFAVGGLPFALVDGDHAAQIVACVEFHLLTPLGLRTLAPREAAYRPRCEGGVVARDGAYHQGTVWPWLIGAFVEAWLKVNGCTPATRAEARERFLAPLLAHLGGAGLGHVSEIADGEAPHTPRGCPWQAWSLSELIRLTVLLTEPEPTAPPAAIPAPATLRHPNLSPA
jgi:glycogen debranching enzyme